MLGQGFTEKVGFEVGVEMGSGHDDKGCCLHS